MDNSVFRILDQQNDTIDELKKYVEYLAERVNKQFSVIDRVNKQFSVIDNVINEIHGYSIIEYLRLKEEGKDIEALNYIKPFIRDRKIDEILK